MYYLTFVAENCDEVSFNYEDIRRTAIESVDYGDGPELECASGTIMRSGDYDHYEFDDPFDLPTSSLRWLAIHADDITQVILESDTDDECETVYVPEDKKLSYMVVNGDLSFTLE